MEAAATASKAAILVKDIVCGRLDNWGLETLKENNKQEERKLAAGKGRGDGTLILCKKEYMYIYEYIYIYIYWLLRRKSASILGATKKKPTGNHW